MGSGPQLAMSVRRVSGKPSEVRDKTVESAVVKRKKSEREIIASNVDKKVLENKLGYRVRILDRLLTREFVQNVGMTQVQFSVLSLVATNEDLSQVAIGEALNMDRASTMAIVHKLEEAGLLRRQKSEHDRRVHALKLTRKGSIEFEELNRKVIEHDSVFSSKLSETELANLYKYIGRLME